jgi:hypothetical protein
LHGERLRCGARCASFRSDRNLSNSYHIDFQGHRLATLFGLERAFMPPHEAWAQEPAMRPAPAMEILSYFTRNPEAADSLEGIARWRLLDEVIYRSYQETEAALGWLVERGFLIETSRPGIKPIFRLNPDRVADSAAVVARHATACAPPWTEECEMPSIIVDSMDDATPWSAFAPDGVTPSTELSLTIDSSKPRPGADPTAGLITATSNALNHRLVRSLGPLDLTKFGDMRFWVYSNRAADGTPNRAFFLELRLASAAMPLTDAGNTWQRYVPVSQTGVWDPVRVTLNDLPTAVRSAVSVIQLRCAAVPFQCDVDDIIAVQDEMIADVDAALLAQLNNVLVLSNPVPAVLHPANGTLTQTRPYFEITNYDILWCRERTDSNRPRGDYTDAGYVIRPPCNAYELYYQVTAVADDRATQAQMLEFLLRTLPVRGALVVNGAPLPMESIMVYPFDQLGGVRTDALPIFYRISSRQEVGTSDAVLPVKTPVVTGGVQSRQPA